MEKYRVKGKEEGAVEVEATVILPLAVLSIVFLLYLSLFLFQRANLQAALETSIIYYRNSVTDPYVTRNSAVVYSAAEGNAVGAGNSYEASRPLNPYRGMFGDSGNLGSQSDFEKYFHSVTGNMLFNDDLSLTITYHNGLIADEFEVTAVQKVVFPMDLSLIGVGKEYEITATARVAAVDHDALIRDADYAIDLVEDSRIGEYAKSIAAKVSEAYGKFKSILGV